MKMFEIMYDLAKIYHKGQVRFDGVTPYITHCEAVAAKFTDDLRKTLGIGHDLKEDTTITNSTLLSVGIPQDVIILLDIMDKNNYPDYAQYLRKVKHNPVTRDVKLADIEHNSSDKPTKRMKIKYDLAKKYLTDQIDFDTLDKGLKELYSK
jgi:hypothetical protein